MVGRQLKESNSKNKSPAFDTNKTYSISTSDFIYLLEHNEKIF